MKSNLKKYITVLFTGLLLAGCTDDFEELNTNPVTYSATSFNPNYLLTSAQLTYSGSTDFSYETWRGNLIYSSTMMQSFATTLGYWAGDKYTLNAAYATAYWDVAYPEQVKPVVDLVELTRDKPQYKNLHNIGRIMRAMILQRITDLYGDVPYFEAGMGYYNKSYFPKYDKQQDIYMDILKEYEEATNNLDLAADKPTGDAMYAGDIAKWKRFGNTLMLRAAMRLSKVQPDVAKTWAQKAVGKTMLSNSDNAFIVNNSAGGRTTVNRNSQVLNGAPEKTETKWSQTFINQLKSTNDPRLPIISVIPPNNNNPADQIGMPNGYDVGTIRNINTAPGYPGNRFAYSEPTVLFRNNDGPTFFLTYAESELLLADAAARFSIAGSASDHYNNGVRAAMTFLSQYNVSATISDAAITAYLAANPYNPANGLTMINTQYWIHASTMLDFYEVWSNWRRTGMPALTPTNYPTNVTGNTIPRRFPYPVREANTNPVNYNAAHNAVPGGDLLIGRVWWDSI